MTNCNRVPYVPVDPKKIEVGTVFHASPADGPRKIDSPSPVEAIAVLKELVVIDYACRSV